MTHKDDADPSAHPFLLQVEQMLELLARMSDVERAELSAWEEASLGKKVQNFL